jgi:hypothetical protein
MLIASCRFRLCIVLQLEAGPRLEQVYVQSLGPAINSRADKRADAEQIHVHTNDAGANRSVWTCHGPRAC